MQKTFSGILWAFPGTVLIILTALHYLSAGVSIGLIILFHIFAMIGIICSSRGGIKKGKRKK